MPIYPVSIAFRRWELNTHARARLSNIRVLLARTSNAFRVVLVLLRAARLRFRGRNRDLRLELEEVLLTDAADVHQFLDLLERPILLSVFDNPSGGFGADARQPFELGR